ncbi:hypothetical protein QJQ45_018336 [Haematococcus lacustris]|nr:hypothetical protein QJQ45_018336 [Haematococcus lacustris]
MLGVGNQLDAAGLMEKSSEDEVITGQQLQGLQGLPGNLLDAVVCQLDASSRLQIFRTSKLLATALLRVVPRIQLTYPTEHDIIGEHLRELAPFLTEVLQNRQHPKLHLTLQPASSLTGATEQSEEAEPAAAAIDAARLAAWMLGAVPLCGAVDSLTINSPGISRLPWEPEFSAALAASFPSLTSLTFDGVVISIGHLVTAISHPLLLPRLLHLDLVRAGITPKGDPGRSPFIGSRLQELSMSGWVMIGGQDDGELKFLPGVEPLPLTLTQLAVAVRLPPVKRRGLVKLSGAVGSLTQLQQLRLIHPEDRERAYHVTITSLLPALAHLPSLHTLVLDVSNVGQEQLDALLALTQVTSLEVLGFSGLTSSRASAACSWRQLKVRFMDWATAAYLPLHSLTHPLRLYRLGDATEEPSEEVLAAAELNLCESNKAGLVLDEGMCLSKANVDLLSELYLSHSLRAAQLSPHPTVASSSSHSGPSTSLASSSSPEGHITPGGPGSISGQGGQQGVSAAGCQAIMQGLGRCVKALHIPVGKGEDYDGIPKDCLSLANRQALAVLFPTAEIEFTFEWAGGAAAATYQVPHAPGVSAYLLKVVQQLGQAIHLRAAGPKVVERLNSGKPTDRLPGKVVTVALSKRFEAPVQGLKWCPWLDQATPGDLGSWVDKTLLLLLQWHLAQDWMTGSQLELQRQALRPCAVVQLLAVSRPGRQPSWQPDLISLGGAAPWSLSPSRQPIRPLSVAQQVAAPGAAPSPPAAGPQHSPQPPSPGVAPSPGQRPTTAVALDVEAVLQAGGSQASGSGLEGQYSSSCFAIFHGDVDLMKKSSAGDVKKGKQLPGLQGLPAELLDAVMIQMDASSRLQVFRTSKLLATALLRRFPRIQLTYPSQHDILGQDLRELAPFLTEVLQNRQQPKLHLTLQPARGLMDAIRQRHRAEPAAAALKASRLVAWMLGAVPLCGAVDCLTISWCDYLDLPWEPAFSAVLAASFRSLTSLTFKDVSISIGHLAKAISHPLLLPQLLHLNLEYASVIHKGQLGRSPFIGSRMQTLRLHLRGDWSGVEEEREFLSGLVPLPPTLTQLTVTGLVDVEQEDWVRLAAAVSSLTQLQQLKLVDEDRDCSFTGLGPMSLLPALAHLPSLHILVVDDIMVGQAQLDALLALTQITRLELYGFSVLTPSALSSPHPGSLSPTASGPTAMGGQQGPGWVEKLEPFWQLFVTYVVEATAGTEHNLAWWMAAVKAGNAYLPDLVTPLQRAQPMNAKMLVGAAAQYVQEVRQQGEGGWEVLLAMAGRMRKRFRSTAAKIPNSRVAAGNGVTAAETPPPDAANTSSPAAAEPAQGASGAAGAVTGAGAAGAGAAAEPVLSQPTAVPQHTGGAPDAAATQAVKQSSSPEPGEGLAACQRAMMTMWQTISYDCIAHCPHTDIAAAAAAQLQQASDVAKACEAVLTKVNALWARRAIRQQQHSNKRDKARRGRKLRPPRLHKSRARAARHWIRPGAKEPSNVEWKNGASMEPKKYRLGDATEEPSEEVLAAAELNLCESNKAGLVLDEGMCLSKANVDLLSELYLSHSLRAAQLSPHPTVASSLSKRFEAPVQGLKWCPWLDQATPGDLGSWVDKYSSSCFAIFHGDVDLMKKSSAGDVKKGKQLPGLQGLPAELLDAVMIQMDASSRLQVFRTSKLLATALLRRFPRIQLTYPSQHDILGQDLRELAPFLTEVLQNRQQPKLHLTLQPARGLMDAIRQRHRAEPAAAALKASRLVAWMLGAVPLCGAVDCLTISWCDYLDLPWEPAFSAVLAASFRSLTSLTFKDVSISIGHLAKAISHPLLLPQLLHLNLEYASVIHKGQLGRSPFIGSRMQTLRLHLRGDWSGVEEEREFLSGLVPLPPTLTQLTVTGLVDVEQEDWVRLAAAVSSLTQLQQLKLVDEDRDCSFTGLGPMSLLPALAHLPSLHILVVDDIMVGQAQLDALLALTQITRLELYGFSGLTTSRASADCSWRQLKVRVLDWVTAAYLPLHSLTHPLHLVRLEKLGEEPTIEVLAAAELNLCERNKAGLVLDEGMYLSKATVDLLTEQHLSHSRRTAHQPPHPSVASSSSHSGPSTSLASSSSPEGHITPGGPGSSTEMEGKQGVSAAGDQSLMQRLGQYVEVLYVMVWGLGQARLSTANRQALAVLFPTAEVGFDQQR